MISLKSLETLEFWKDYRQIWLESTGSSNDDLKALWHLPDYQHTIEVADSQTNGKGQYSRRWASDAGQCLMFSYSFDVKEFTFPVSMLAGVALAMALEDIGLPREVYWLKWPNDVWACQDKLAGILTESTYIKDNFRCVVGVGLNIKKLSDRKINSISLQELGIDITRETMLLAFCKAWEKVFYYSAAQQKDLWKKYSHNFFNNVFEFNVPSEDSFRGLPLDIEKDGTLIVEQLSDKKVRKVISASLMPIFV